MYNLTKFWLISWVCFCLLGSACTANRAATNTSSVTQVSATHSPTHTQMPPSQPETAQPSPSAVPPTATMTATATNTPTRTAVTEAPPANTPPPTATPHLESVETASIFLMLSETGGDGGSYDIDVDMGDSFPDVVIFTDGHMLQRRGARGQYQLQETYLTEADLCDLRQQILMTGFLDTHDDYYTAHTEFEGAPYLNVQFEGHTFRFYTPDIPYLIDEMAAGLQVMQTFSPTTPMTPYIPSEMIVWTDEIEPDGETAVVEWPAPIPPLSELWTNTKIAITVPSEYIVPLYAWFDNRITQRVIIEDGIYYRLIPYIRERSLEQESPETYASPFSCPN